MSQGINIPHNLTINVINMTTTASDKKRPTLLNQKDKTTVSHTLRNATLALSGAAILTLQSCSKPTEKLQTTLGRESAPPIVQLTPDQKNSEIAADRSALNVTTDELKKEQDIIIKQNVQIANLQSQINTFKSQNGGNQPPADNQPASSNQQPAQQQQSAPQDNSQQQSAPQDNTQQYAGSAIGNAYQYAQPIQVAQYGLVAPCPIYPLWGPVVVETPYCWGVSPYGYPYIWGYGGFAFWGRERFWGGERIGGNNYGGNRSLNNNNQNNSNTKTNNGNTNGNTGQSTKSNGTQNPTSRRQEPGFSSFTHETTGRQPAFGVQQLHNNQNILRRPQTSHPQQSFQHPQFQGNPSYARPPQGVGAQQHFSPHYGAPAGAAPQSRSGGGGGNRGGGGGGGGHGGGGRH